MRFGVKVSSFGFDKISRVEWKIVGVLFEISVVLGIGWHEVLD
jgi:hypothetical protein